MPAVTTRCQIMKLILEILDWAVMVVERLLVLALGFLVFYFGYLLLRGSFTQNQSDILKSLSDNWKVGTILLIALFYGTVRKFLEEVHEAWGMKKREQTGEPKKLRSRPKVR
jgi:predicted ABC-type exoprotein transport system permease subunit